MPLNHPEMYAPLVTLLLLAPSVMGSGVLQPYILGHENTPMNSALLKAKLQIAGFEVLGTFSPAKDYETIAFTHTDLKKEASSASVPIGAVLRASLVKNAGKTELSYCSPHYWAYASGLQGAASDVIATKLQNALGKQQSFGSEKGLTQAKLRSFQYAFAMPKVNDLDQLGKFNSFGEATAAVKKGLEASSKAKEVYSLDIDKNTRLIGVNVLEKNGAESTILRVTDAGPGPKLGGLYGPYEMFIKGGEVKATRGRFRIAVAFPDLSMGTFMRIKSAPGGILDSLKSTLQTG